MPPDHQVGVGPQAGDVVPAADHQVLSLGRPARWPERAARRLRSASSLEPAGRPEHRPHRVADRVVDLPRLHRVPRLAQLVRSSSAFRRQRLSSAIPALGTCQVAVILSPPPSRSRGRRRSRRRPARRRRPPAPAAASSAAPQRGDPLAVPDQILRQPAAPAADVPGDQVRPGPARAAAAPRRTSAAPAPRRGTCSSRSSPSRPTLARTTATPRPQRPSAASATQAHLAEE